MAPWCDGVQWARASRRRISLASNELNSSRTPRGVGVVVVVVVVRVRQAKRTGESSGGRVAALEKRLAEVTADAENAAELVRIDMQTDIDELRLKLESQGADSKESQGEIDRLKGQLKDVQASLARSRGSCSSSSSSSFDSSSSSSSSFDFPPCAPPGAVIEVVASRSVLPGGRWNRIKKNGT